MNHHDDEILRLNKKIKQLIWRNEQSEEGELQLVVNQKDLTFLISFPRRYVAK